MRAAVVAEPVHPAPRSPDGTTSSTAVAVAAHSSDPGSRDNVNVLRALRAKIKIANAHALLISGLEFALSLTNALDSGAFGAAESARDVIFAGSAVMEFAGFFFALRVAARNAMNAEDNDGGSPIVMIWAANTSRSDAEMGDAVMAGLGGQAFAFWLFCLTRIRWRAIWPVVTGADALKIMMLGLFLLGFVPCVQLYLAHARQSRARRRGAVLGTREAACDECCLCFLFFVLALPMVVEIAESIVIFGGTSPSSSSYVLGVLDLVLVVPAWTYVCDFFPRVVDAVRSAEEEA